jgi:hypothetical protein
MPLEPSLSISPYPSTPPSKRCRQTPLASYSPGDLGKLASQNAQVLATMGWDTFFRYRQHPTSIHPTIINIPHPTAPYLHRLADAGVPAYFTTAWTKGQLHAAYNCGPHPSAAKHYAEFLVQDMWDYDRMGFWTILPFSSIAHHPALRLAPAGVVPQRERRPRPIMDYTFHGTNAACLAIAPQHAMQFGGALQRILQRLVYSNATYGPPLLAKIDLADGYYGSLPIDNVLRHL